MRKDRKNNLSATFIDDRSTPLLREESSYVPRIGHPWPWSWVTASRPKTWYPPTLHDLPTAIISDRRTLQYHLSVVEKWKMTCSRAPWMSGLLLLAVINPVWPQLGVQRNGVDRKHRVFNMIWRSLVSRENVGCPRIFIRHVDVNHR